MKKTILLFTILTTLSVTSADITSNLKYSQSSNQVKELQEFLISKGFLTSNSSGFFGSLTLKAVKAYQASVNLPTSGFVGLMTRTKINESLKVASSISVASSTPTVATSTPIIQATVTPPVAPIAQAPVIQYIYVTVAPVPPVVEVVKEEVYYLDFTSIDHEIGYNSPLKRMDAVGFSFVPRATLNGDPIAVKSCYIPYYGRYTSVPLFNGKIAYGYTSGDYVNRLTANEHGIITCVLVNGKEVSN